MSRDLFLVSVGKVFKEWKALKMAVDNSFGGVYSLEKAEWMVEVTGEFIWDNWPVSVDEVEDYVATIMNQEFDTLLEDGSLSQISQWLCDLRKVCLDGTLTAVDEYLSKRVHTQPPLPNLQSDVPSSTCPVDPSSCIEPLQNLTITVDSEPTRGVPKVSDSMDTQEELAEVASIKESEDGWTVVSKGKNKQR